MHNPNIIFAPFYQDNHSDHAETGKLLKKYSPVFYLPHSSISPNYIVNISKVFNKRMKSVYFFKSQTTKKKINLLISRLKKYGKKINCDYAEGFYYKGEETLPEIFTSIK